MRVERGESVFEMSIYAVEDEWEGKIVEYTMLSLLPTVHLQHRWTSQEAAIAGVQRRWRRLFPAETDEHMPDVSAAVTVAEAPLVDMPALFSWQAPV